MAGEWTKQRNIDATVQHELDAMIDKCQKALEGLFEVLDMNHCQGSEDVEAVHG